MSDDLLEILRKNHALGAIDVHFARFLGELSSSGDPEILLAAALASRATGAGDICLDLQALAGTMLLAEDAGRQAVACPRLRRWEQRLRDSAIVGRPGDRRPLVLDDRHRLYLYRYWRYEKDLSEAIARRIRSDRTADRVDHQRLRQGLQQLFPPRKAKGVDWQKVAALVAVLKPFCVITGGPGTGKTSTVGAILALLLGQRPAGSRILLAAPTGKAAARLGEALQTTLSTLPLPDSARGAIPTEAVTLHRLLRSIPGTHSFRHNASNPLAADAVIVDEASMVDLALMAKLVQAVDERTQLVLIGDKDQLASVEAGAVLGDLCDRSCKHGYSEDFRRMVEAFTGEQLPPIGDRGPGGNGLQDCIVELRHSYRFTTGGGIGALSRSVNKGDALQALGLLQDPSETTVRWMPTVSAMELHRQLAAAIAADVGAYRAIRDPRQALTAFKRFGLLCAVNKGPCGVEAVNRLVQQLLSTHRRIPPASAGEDQWYEGRPVMITRNDYHLGLFNGDIGIAMPASPDSPGFDLQQPGPARLMVYFQGTDDQELRQIPPYRLSAYQTAYAMTVHKSQGSEFDTVHLVLPQQDAMVLCRELIYTALTRARRQVVIWGPEHVLAAAINRKIQRRSGLRDALWG
jgi:exodeoxyribonuclease V alpha subunit